MARITVLTLDFLQDPADRLAIEAKGHRLLFCESMRGAIEPILSDPPECLLIQKDLPDGLDKTIVAALKNDLKLSFLPILLVVSKRDLLNGLDFTEYPVDELIRGDASPEEVVTRIGLCISRMQRVADNNPLTGLPGNTSILKTIQGYLDARLERAVAYADIDNFKPLNDKYGFARGDEVIRMTARLLVNVVADMAGREGFVGHVGGDDFVFAAPIHRMEDICREVVSNFDSLIKLFMDDEDVKRGCFESKDRSGRPVKFPLTSISIGVVLCTPGRYVHYGEVSQVAAQLKKLVKAREGSTFLVDRRTSNEDIGTGG